MTRNGTSDLSRDALSKEGAFHEFGAQIIPGVVPPDELPEVRAQVLKITQSGFGRHIQAPELYDYPDVLRYMYSDRLTTTLKSIFGDDLAYFPSVQIQLNSFTQPKGSKIGGWHVDASREVKDARSYVYQPASVWSNIGLYLQDADNHGYGGGVMMIPGSHRFFQRSRRFAKLASLGHTLFTHATQLVPTEWLRPVPVPTKAGDAIVFDCRLLHTSIPSKVRVQGGDSRKLFRRHQAHVTGIPPEYHKYVMYWFCSRREIAQECLENNFYRRARTLSADYAASGGFDYRKLCRVAETPYPEAITKWASERGVHLVAREGAPL